MKSFLGRIFSFPKRMKEKRARGKVGEGNIGMEGSVDSEDIKRIPKEDEDADAEQRNLSEGKERRGLRGASEGREEQQKLRKSHEEAQGEPECTNSVVLEEKPSEGRVEVVVGKDVREDVMYEILAEIKNLNTRMKAIEEARN
jgi:hypothetical protein